MLYQRNTSIMPGRLASFAVSVVGRSANPMPGRRATVFLRVLLTVALVISVSLAPLLHHAAAGQTLAEGEQSSAEGGQSSVGFVEAGADLSWSGSTSIADVDGDGNKDLLIGTTLYLGDGQGGFSEAGVDLSGGGSTSIADVDGDGNQDLLITGEDANGNVTATLYLGDGQGGFEAAGAGLTGVSGGSTSIADVNADGNEDLLITGGTVTGGIGGRQGTATLYLGDGQGGFSEAGAGLTGVLGGSTSIADVDGDGHKDLLITGDCSNPALPVECFTSYLSLGDGQGGFEAADAGLTGVSGGSTSIADVNADGNEDLLITGGTVTGGIGGRQGTATLYLGDGQGGFSEAGAGLTGVLGGSTSIADVDGDGHKDLLITGDCSNPALPVECFTSYLSLGDGQGGFEAADAGLTGVSGGSTSIADVNGDDKPDLLITGREYGREYATLYINQTNWSPTASDDSDRTMEGTEVTTDVLANDTDPDGSLVDSTVQVQSGPSDGSATANNDGTITYVPGEGFSGEDSYTYTVSDDQGAVSQEATVTVTVRPAQTQATTTQSFGGGQKEDYRLVALPGQASATLSETISGDWRGFQEEGTSGGQAYSRQECSGGCEFGPGKGFWLIAGETWQVDRTVEAAELSQGGTMEIGLQDGWNVVSNPLETDVSWSAVQQASGTSQPLWEFSGGWDQDSTFQSAKEGEAYYFRDDQISALTVPYPGAGGSSAQGKPQAKADTAQVEGGARRALTLSVASGGEAVTSVRAGVRPEAEEGLDRFDHYGPPGYFGPATLRLMQHRNSGEEGEERPVALATEYRGPGGEGYSYDLRLRASADTALTLQAGGLSEFEGEQVSLVETATGEAHALQEGEEITILQRTAEARYRLLIGSESYVEAKKENIRPSEVRLLPNYPNPFARQTTIEYALPEAQAVRLAVYDVLGRQVAVLQDGKQEGGFHRVQWQAGGGLSSGVYFVRLRAGEQTRTQKLTVVR